MLQKWLKYTFFSRRSNQNHHKIQGFTSRGCHFIIPPPIHSVKKVAIAKFVDDIPRVLHFQRRKMARITKISHIRSHFCEASFIKMCQNINTIILLLYMLHLTNNPLCYSYFGLLSFFQCVFFFYIFLANGTPTIFNTFSTFLLLNFMTVWHFAPSCLII